MGFSWEQSFDGGRRSWGETKGDVLIRCVLSKDLAELSEENIEKWVLKISFPVCCRISMHFLKGSGKFLERRLVVKLFFRALADC